MDKLNLSKTVLDMRFMKKSKIELQKREEDTENIEVLTANIGKEGRICSYVLERSWELVQDLKSPRFNYGMGQENVKKSVIESAAAPAAASASEKIDSSPSQPPRKKHKKY